MTVVLVACAVMLGVGAVLALIRVEKGPSVLDRAVGLDIITSVLIIAVCVEAAANRRTDTVPVLAALALVGFVSSLAIARFAAVEPEDARRIKTAGEIAAEDAARAKLEEEAVIREAEAAARRDEELGF
jgi:multicomponent Na+:H+ antiporter subunit F